MPKIKGIKPNKLLKALLLAGYEVDRIRGSHHILFNPTTKSRVVIPMHNKDLPTGTAASILKESGLSIDTI